jgi:hypothetical protein
LQSRGTDAGAIFPRLFWLAHVGKGGGVGGTEGRALRIVLTVACTWVETGYPTGQ